MTEARPQFPFTGGVAILDADIESLVGEDEVTYLPVSMRGSDFDSDYFSISPYDFENLRIGHSKRQSSPIDRGFAISRSIQDVFRKKREKLAAEMAQREPESVVVTNICAEPRIEEQPRKNAEAWADFIENAIDLNGGRAFSCVPQNLEQAFDDYVSIVMGRLPND